MTTLADVNATLGVQNIALSEVAKAQKETNTGISAFLEHIKATDSRDRRESQEDRREAKKASVIGGTLSAAGGYAKSAGGALVDAGKSGLGLGKSALGKLKGIGTLGTGFLGGLLGSKLLRFGLPAIGFLMGDQIAEMLAGPDAKKEVKDMLGGAIKGGALGFLLGPRFAAIGFILGGLLKNEKIDQEVGDLITNLRDLQVKFPALGKFFTGITSAIGSGLESINKLLEGTSEDKVTDIAKSIAVIGGVAALLMPGKMLGLMAAATRLMLTTPAGIALLAVAGGGVAINKLMGGEGSEATGFGVSALTTGAAYLGGKAIVNKIRGKSGSGGKPSIGKPDTGLRGNKGLEGKMDKNLVQSLRKFPRLAKYIKFASKFGGPLAPLLGVASLLEMIRSGNVNVDSISGLFGGVLGGVGGAKLGALIGTMFGPGPGTIVGSALGGGLGYLAGDTIAKALAQWMLGKKVDAFYFDAINDLFNEKSSSSDSKNTEIGMSPGAMGGKIEKSPTTSGVRNQFEINRVAAASASGTDPSGNPTSAIVNSGNTTNNYNTSQNSAISFGHPLSGIDLGDQISGVRPFAFGGT